MRRALEYAARPRRHARPALRGRVARRRRPHARGGVVEPARHPRHAGRGRGADGHPRHRAGPAHRRAGPLPAPVDGRVASSWSARPRPTGCPSRPRRRRTTSRSPTPSCAGFDPVFKVNPPLRTDADVAAVKAGLADGTIDAIATDHAPHTPGGQGAAVRPGAAGDARPRDRAGAGAHRARPADRRDVLALLSWQPAAIAGLGDTHGGPIAPGAPANLCVIDPAADVDGRPGRAGQPQPQHALRRPQAHGPGPPHDPRGRAGRRSTARRSDDADRPRPMTRPGCARGRRWSWPTATTFEGEAIGRRPARAASPPARSCSTPCCPATRRSSPTRRTPGRSSPSPTRTSATTASTPPTTRAAGPFCRGVVVRELARRRSNWRSDGRPRRLPAPPRRRRHRRHRHPPAHPPHPRRRRDARRVRHGRRGRRCSAAAAAEPGTDGIDLVAEVTTRRAVHGRRRRRCRVVAYDFGIKRDDPAPPRRLATVEVVPGVDAGRRRARPRARRRVPVERPRRPGDGRLRRRQHRARCSARCRCSASASATSSSAPRSAARTFKLPFGHHGGNHPVRHLTTGHGRDHQPEPQLRGRRRRARRRRRGHPRQPQRRRRRGPARAATRRRSACSTTPRPGPARTTPATCSTSSPT